VALREILVRIGPDPAGGGDVRTFRDTRDIVGGPRIAPSPTIMVSQTPTLLDPYELAGGTPPRARMPSLLDQATEWFDRTTLGFLDIEVASVEEYSETPPWTPEPVDRRWRARGWMDD
jgi:hypothetical protein